MEGNITDAEEALRDAEEALGDAQAAYNDAVAGQESAKKEAAALFEQKTADYKKAAEEWAHLEGTYLADIETEKVNVKDAKDALDNKYPTPPKEGEDGYADYIASDEFKAYQESEGKLRTARETYVQQKSNFQNIQQVYNQAQTDYQNQLASIASSASGAMSGVASAQSGVAAAEAQLDAAQDARNGASMAQLEQGVDSAKRGVDSAQLQKEIAQNQVSNAKDQREASNNAIEQQIDSLKDSLVGSQIAAQSTQSQEIAIQKMQNTLEDATITAPVSGVVTAVYAKVGEPGNGLLFVVEDTQSLKINTKIKEYDVANIREGMPVVIKSDATGDQEISGTVTYIAPAAVKTEAGNTQTGGNDSNVEFEAEVQVNDPNCGLRIGMNTRLTVLLEEKQDVFGVPYDAVVEKADGSTVVYAAVEQQNSGKNSSYVVTEIPVTTGLETDFYIEISGGEVTPGMAVISNPQSVTPGMEVTPDFVANGTTQPTVGLS